jgi:ribose transport system ATP-binding protein
VNEGFAETRLSISGLSKAFPGVKALRDVELRVDRGSVHALLGHNGCGKSTLVKILAGFHAPDAGSVARVDGELVELGSPDNAARAGLRFVHQDLGLIAELGAADNIGLAVGYEGRRGKINWQRQRRETVGLLESFGIDLDPLRPLGEATPTQRTSVAIVRAVSGLEPGRGVLVLDEPTAALPAHEVGELFRIIREVRASGTPVLLISHRLDEIIEIADHATVLQAGTVKWSGPVAETSVKGLAHLIVGSAVEAIEDAPPRSRQAATGPAPLVVKGLRTRFLDGVDLTVERGEIVGVAGLLGSGREELPYAVAGAYEEPMSGQISIEGEEVEDLDIRQVRERGLALVPADRAKEGIFAEFTVRENVTLASLPGIGSSGVVAPSRERRFAHDWLLRVDADPAVIDRAVTTLSGGNQQKTVLARWLSVEPTVLAVAEPTAGIDIGARASIYRMLRAKADEGLSVLMSSSDSDDLVAVCDRVLVLRDGAIVAELNAGQISKPAIVAATEGVHGDHD